MTENTKNVDCSGRLGQGVYTIPDVARILRLPPNKVRRWISGYWKVETAGRRVISAPIIEDGSWSLNGSHAINFHALIEVFIFMALREFGAPLQRVRQARAELMDRFQTPFPFACHKLLCDGRQIMVVLEDVTAPMLMILGEGGQTALDAILEPFSKRIDFSLQTCLAERYWPLGKERAVVVDPHHGFGRPTIAGTNITTTTIAALANAGENTASIAELYRIDEKAVDDVVEFEHREAA